MIAGLTSSDLSLETLLSKSLPQKQVCQVQFYIHAGSFADVTAFKTMSVDLPQHSQLYADNGFNCYELEDLFCECEQIDLRVCRNCRAKRKDEPYLAFLKTYYRKRIETTFSGITSFFPKKIHAVTAQGFILKIMLFIFAYTLNQLV